MRTIAIHADAPAKPAFGAACNGCGACCLAEPCPIGMLASRRRRGACSALRWDEAVRRYRCGLVAQERPWLAALARRWIAAGRGCDSDAEFVAS
jgi:Fe-S-cluster-containing hydrogenase component 2